MESLKAIKDTINFLASCNDEETRKVCIKSLNEHLEILEKGLNKERKLVKKYERQISQLISILNPQMNLEGFEDD